MIALTHLKAKFNCRSKNEWRKPPNVPILRKVFNKIITATALAGSVAVAWYAHFVLDSVNTLKIFYTLLALLINYTFFEILLKNLAAGRIADAKNRYSVRKGLSLANISIFLVVLLTVWMENVQALFVAYGLVAAGVAIALQDFFKNLVGGILLLTRGNFRAGDRVEVDGVLGDVIDVGFLYTTMLELKNWVDGDQATGRLTFVPNGKILSGLVQNYTKDNTIVWDEIHMPITYKSNWKKTRDFLNEMAQKETQADIDLAEGEIAKLSSKFYLSSRDASPAVYVRMTDNWIELQLRYVTQARSRRDVQNHITQEILDWVEHQNDVEIASATLEIVNLPVKQ